jgi:hypothetical protein
VILSEIDRRFKFNFASFFSRDKAFDVLTTVWKNSMQDKPEPDPVVANLRVTRYHEYCVTGN